MAKELEQPQPVVLQRLEDQYREQNDRVLEQGVLERNVNPEIAARNTAKQQHIQQLRQQKGQEFTDFIVSNLTQQTPGAAQTLNAYRKGEITNPDGTITQDPFLWETFKGIATEVLVQNRSDETVNQFIQRVGYTPPAQGYTPTQEDALPAPLPQEEQIHGIKKQVNEADQYAAQFLKPVRDAFFIANQKWFEKQQEEKTDKNGVPYSWVNYLIEAIEYAFDTGASRGHKKKWKELLGKIYGQRPEAISQKIQEIFKHHPAAEGNFFKAIDIEILQAKESVPPEQPASTMNLLALVQSKDKQIRNIVREHVLGCAYILSAQKEGAQSLNAPAGDKGQIIDNINDEKAVDPAALLQEMPNNQIDLCNNAWTTFVNNPQNKDVLNRLRTERLGHATAGDSMFPVLMQTMRCTEKYLMDEAVSTAFLGFSSNDDPKWKAFFANNPQLATNGNENNLLQQLIAIAGGQQEGLPQLQDFVFKNAYDFLAKMFQERKLDKRGTLGEIAPGMGSMKTFQNINNLVCNYLLRHYKYMNQVGMESAYGSARRYALMKAKGDALVMKFRQMTQNRETIPVTEDTEIGFSENLNALVVRKKEKVLGRNKGYRWNERLLTKEDFPLLSGMLNNQEWVPRAIELMQDKKRFPEVDPKTQQPVISLMLARNKAHRGDSPLINEVDTATLQYRQEHPDETDRLKGYRIKMGQTLRSLREQAHLSVEDVANLIRAQERRGINANSRIATDPEGIINDLENGIATTYGLSDFGRIAKALGQDAEAFYVRPMEYDPYCVDDYTDLNNTIGQSFRIYGTYLLHRKKEAIRRGIRDDFFSPQNMNFYLKLMTVHPNFSSPPREKANRVDDSESRIGKMLYQLTNEPVGGKQFTTMDQIQENLGNVSNEDINIPGGKSGLVPNFRGPRKSKDFETGEETELPPSLMHRYYYDPLVADDPFDTEQGGVDPTFLPPEEQAKDPNDIRRKWYQPDPEQWLTFIQKVPFKDETGEEAPRTLQFYIDRAKTRMQRHATDASPEQYEAQIERENPLRLARNMLKQIWPKRKVDGRMIDMDDATADHMLRSKMQAANEYNRLHAKGVEPEQYDTLEEFCQSFVKNEIRTRKILRNEARLNLERLQDKFDGSLSDQIRYFVPASVRHKALFAYESDYKGQVPLREVYEPGKTDEQGNPIEKFDSLDPVNMVLGAMEEMDRIGDLYAIASQFEFPYALHEMLQSTTRAAINALVKFS